jgi:hypothetical protein
MYADYSYSIFFYNSVFKKKKEKEKLEAVCPECYAVQH